MTDRELLEPRSRRNRDGDEVTTLAKHGNETMRAAERTHAQPGASQSRQSHAPRPQSRQQG